MDDPLLRDDVDPEERESSGLLFITPNENEQRKIHIGSVVEPEEGFISNTVTTAKYNCFTFLPLNLGQQFQRAANFYFLVLSVLVCFPAISPYNMPESTIMPFVFVVALSAIKDAYTDYKRHQDDHATNTQTASVLTKGAGSRFLDCKWCDVVVGDIVRVREDESIPADMIVLSSTTQESVMRSESRRATQRSEEVTLTLTLTHTPLILTVAVTNRLVLVGIAWDPSEVRMNPWTASVGSEISRVLCLLIACIQPLLAGYCPPTLERERVTHPLETIS